MRRITSDWPRVSTVLVGIVCVAWLLLTALATWFEYGYARYGCEGARVDDRFETRLWDPTDPVEMVMVGADGQPVRGQYLLIPISRKISDCLPDRVVGGRLTLPPGVSPGQFRGVLRDAFNASRGLTTSDDWRNHYPMNTSAAACLTAALGKINEEALASLPPPIADCSYLVSEHLRKWLFLGVCPVALMLAAIWVGRRTIERRAREITRR